MPAQITSGSARPNATVLETQLPKCAVLFAVGRGGNPERHLKLLHFLAAEGCTVVAPHFEMLASPTPTVNELALRIEQSKACIDAYAPKDMPLVGIGHSIGAVILLALAGAEAETIQGNIVSPSSGLKFAKLALFAPSTDFFRRPGALKLIKMPIKVWVGDNDSITPPTQAYFLQEALQKQTSVAICLDPDAGHFSFMDVLPPGVRDPHPNQNMFQMLLNKEVNQFLLQQPFQDS